MTFTLQPMEMPTPGDTITTSNWCCLLQARRWESHRQSTFWVPPVLFILWSHIMLRWYNDFGQFKDTNENTMTVRQLDVGLPVGGYLDCLHVTVLLFKSHFMFHFLTDSVWHSWDGRSLSSCICCEQYAGVYYGRTNQIIDTFRSFVIVYFSNTFQGFCPGFYFNLQDVNSDILSEWFLNFHWRKCVHLYARGYRYPPPLALCFCNTSMCNLISEKPWY